jgi:hypothetical protein
MSATTNLTTQTMTGLWLTTGSNILWSLDTTGDAVYHFTDTMAVAVAGAAATPTTTTAALSWTAVEGATAYAITMNTRSDFLGTAVAVVTNAWDITTATAAGLTAGTTYYWTVNATAPFASRASTAESFTCVSGVAVAVVALQAPVPGATGVPIRPVFQWAPVAGARNYELDVSLNDKFRGTFAGDPPLISRTRIEGNVFACEIDLEYDTEYFWRVRATTHTSAVMGVESGWTMGVFRTRLEPEPPVVVEPTPPPETPEIILPVAETPLYIWVVIGIGAVLVIAVIVLIVRTRRPV